MLKSLQAITTQNWARLRTELQAYAALRGRTALKLSDFLHEQSLEIEDVYRASTGQGRSGWTALKRDAGLIASEPGPEEAYLSRRFGALLHIDDPRRLDLMMGVGAGSPSLQAPSPADAMGLQMLAYQIDGRNKAAAGPQEFLARLRLHPQACDELAELTPMLQARSTLARRPVPGLEDTPLCLHAAYGIREVLTAVGWLTAQRRAPFQAGVLPLTDRKTELLFVTLDKSEGYHDSIAYHDYAISVDRFHWQTQNSAGPDTNSGRRYIESAANGWQFQLFVRPRKTDPYRACGRVTLESFEGDRPMNIVWKFTTPLPARLFREYSVLRGA